MAWQGRPLSWARPKPNRIPIEIFGKLNGVQALFSTNVLHVLSGRHPSTYVLLTCLYKDLIKETFANLCPNVRNHKCSLDLNMVLMALSDWNTKQPQRRFTAGSKVAGMAIRIQKPEAVALCNYTVDGSLWIRVNCCLQKNLRVLPMSNMEREGETDMKSKCGIRVLFNPHSNWVGWSWNWHK